MINESNQSQKTRKNKTKLKSNEKQKEVEKVTREEFPDNAKDFATMFVSAFDLEDLQFLE